MHATQKQHTEMPVRVSARFLEADLFARTYCRNNPKKGVKHLRCFPHCSPLGHREATFCGRPLNVEITLGVEEDDSQTIDMHDLLYVGEFVPVWALHDQPRMQVSEQWIQDNSRTPTNPRGTLYKGSIGSTALPRYGGAEEKMSVGITTGASNTVMTRVTTAGAASSTVQATNSGTSLEDAHRLSFVVRFNDSDTGAWQCGIRTTTSVRYAFCVRVLRLAPEIMGDAEDTFEEVFRALSPPFLITSARRLSSVKASAKGSQTSEG